MHGLGPTLPACFPQPLQSLSVGDTWTVAYRYTQRPSLPCQTAHKEQTGTGKDSAFVSTPCAISLIELVIRMLISSTEARKNTVQDGA